MTTIELMGELALEVLKTINKPQAEKWAKDILNLKQERRNEENKPSLEERTKYPDLKDRNFRNNAIIDELDAKLFDISKAVLATSRGK